MPSLKEFKVVSMLKVVISNYPRLAIEMSQLSERSRPRRCTVPCTLWNSGSARDHSIGNNMSLRRESLNRERGVVYLTDQAGHPGREYEDAPSYLIPQTDERVRWSSGEPLLYEYPSHFDTGDNLRSGCCSCACSDRRRCHRG